MPTDPRVVHTFTNLTQSLLRESQRLVRGPTPLFNPIFQKIANDPIIIPISNSLEITGWSVEFIAYPIDGIIHQGTIWLIRKLKKIVSHCILYMKLEQLPHPQWFKEK